MPLPGQRLFAILTAGLILLAAVPTTAATLDYDSFRWSDEYGSAPSEDGQVLPGRLVVRFATGSRPAAARAAADGTLSTGSASLDAVARQIGARDIERMFPEFGPARRALAAPERDGFYIVQFDPEASSVLEAAEAMATVDGVTEVFPDEVFRTRSLLPNDPQLPNQWWLRNTSIGGADIRAVGAWSYTTGSPDVIVCVADSGVDWQHPDLGGTGPDYTDGVIFINQAEYTGIPGHDDDGNGKVDDIRGWDFVSGLNPNSTQQNPPQDVSTQDNDPMDYGAHGTAVAGCVAAISDNGIGIASINWNVKILPCRIGWTDDAGTNWIGMSFAAQSMDYERSMGADVYNASWGSSEYFLAAPTSLLISSGAIVVEAAGNDDDEIPDYLGSRTDVISVAATTSGDSKANFSDYGAWIDISAPGVSITTTSYNPSGSGGTEHTYTSTQGTSFASPIVAGAFAMARSVYTTDTRQQLIDRVLAAVDDISAQNPGIGAKLGSGRINLTKLFFDGTFYTVPGLMPGIVDALHMADVGDTIAVESGFVIPGPFSLPAEVETTILGGFDPTYTTRDPLGNPSIIDHQGPTGTALRFTAGVTPNLVLDGFLVTGGKNTSPSFYPDEGSYGGGIQIYQAAPTLRNFIVTGNQAGNTGENGYGGGIAILSADPVLENVQVIGNQAKSGAGIYIWDSNPTLINVSARSNTNWSPAFGGPGVGGGLYLRDCPPAGARRVGGITLDGGSFVGNSSPGNGGAIYAADSDLTISHVTVDSNSCLGAGAGIAVSGGSLDLSASSFGYNSITPSASLTTGGGLFTTGATVVLDSLEFRGNSATLAGGAISIGAAGSFDLSNSLVVENTAGYFGAGIYVANGAPGMALVGNTIANNSGGSLGGNGVYVNGGNVDFQQNVIAFNVDGSTSPNGVNLSGATATFTCNLLHANELGNVGGGPDPVGTDGNIDVDPLFCDMGAGEYTLSVTSPAANAACGYMGSQPTACGGGTGVDDDVPSGLVRRFALEQNRPNPFNPTTLIEFSVPRGGPVQLRVYDLRGRLVRTLVDREYEAGSWSVTWDGRDGNGRTVASGTYLYELRADGDRRVRKMGLLK